ncbi:hypothetical protein BGX30_000209 [Mortierella sp. GBA39]|nr:hypothetical protein BGX30_000209 [Mortierella sp. GBA39]
MSTSTPRLYDLNGERYDLSVDILFSPTAFVPESYTRRKVYGDGTRPDKVDVVALANRVVSKAMCIRRTIALITVATPPLPPPACLPRLPLLIAPIYYDLPLATRGLGPSPTTKLVQKDP